jgi:glycerol-3-phosphate acyltransferase PlsY
MKPMQRLLWRSAAMLRLVILPAIAYTAGSVPVGLILTRLFTTTDLRGTGSGNIGATNVTRLVGPLLGSLALMGDLLKGAVPVALAVAWLSGDGAMVEGYRIFIALCAIAGHIFPVFLRFRGGGKGVATTAGCFLILSPAATAVSLLVFILMVCITSRVSPGSLTAAAMLPLAVWQFDHSSVLTVGAATAALVIIWRHQENIRRLVAGQEPPIW